MSRNALLSLVAILALIVCAGPFGLLGCGEDDPELPTNGPANIDEVPDNQPPPPVVDENTPPVNTAPPPTTAELRDLAYSGNLASVPGLDAAGLAWAQQYDAIVQGLPGSPGLPTQRSDIDDYIELILANQVAYGTALRDLAAMMEDVPGGLRTAINDPVRHLDDQVRHAIANMIPTSVQTDPTQLRGWVMDAKETRLVQESLQMVHRGEYDEAIDHIGFGEQLAPELLPPGIVAEDFAGPINQTIEAVILPEIVLHAMGGGSLGESEPAALAAQYHDLAIPAEVRALRELPDEAWDDYLTRVRQAYLRELNAAADALILAMRNDPDDPRFVGYFGFTGDPEVDAFFANKTPEELDAMIARARELIAPMLTWNIPEVTERIERQVDSWERDVERMKDEWRRRHDETPD